MSITLTPATPQFAYLRCYDAEGRTVRVSALNLDLGMGYWQGQALPIAKYEFVAPDAKTVQTLRETLPYTCVSKVRMEGEKPAQQRRLGPGTIQYPNFVEIRDPGDDW